MKRRIVATIGMSLFIFAGCSGSMPEKVIWLRGPAGEEVIIHAEIAETPADQEQGLMNRTALADDAGMLFVFPSPSIVSFWMKDTLIPLDILFFDAEDRFAGSQTMQPCPAEEEQCPAIRSAEAVTAALEVNAGFVERNKIGAGWKITPARMDDDSK
ncbi:MAG: DUF192 domain-containing protein [Candidatus Peregrinibacteria bacterium]